jgi:hypothetical protein
MDRARILDTLELTPGGALSFSSISLAQWGRDVLFECEYLSVEATVDEPVEFQLIFRDCREIRIKTYAHIAEHELGEFVPRADVAEIALGLGNHRRDANILTNQFSITLSFGSIQVERHGHYFSLPV